MRKPKLWVLSSLALLLILSALALPAKSQEEPSILWVNTFDGGSSDEARDVAVDSMNNIIVTGWSVQGTPQNYMTVKYDGNGNEIWNRTYGEGRQARSVAVDSLDNILVTGFQFNGFTDSFLTIKYDKNGNLLWNSTIGEEWQGEGVAVDSQDNVIVVGYYYPDIDMEKGWDVKIVKYDSNGNEIWSRTYDDLEGEHALDVAVDSKDNIIITGNSYDGMTRNLIALKYDKDGNLLWNRMYNGGYEDEGHSVTVDSLDNVIATGFTSDTTYRYFLTIKYDKDGNRLWTKTYRKELKDEAHGVAVDSKDNILVTGWSFDGTTRYLTTIEYDKDGNQLWTTSYRGSPEYGSLAEVRGYGVAVDQMDDIILTGASSRALGIPTDFFTMKLRAAGMSIVEVHDVVVDGTIFHVTTESNSTISNFNFIKEDKKLLFNVTGPPDTNGFCNITIPNQLLGGPFSVTFDGQLMSEMLTSDNGTHTWLHFTYPHSVHRIEIIGTTAIPESHPTILLPLFAFVTLIAVALARKIRRKEKRAHESRFCFNTTLSC